MIATTDTVAGVSAATDVPLERVEAELCTLAGQIAAATSRFLGLLADFDARDGWAGWGVRSCAHWLSWRCGLDLRTARDQVRVARALTGLPQIGQAFGQGRLSYSKVRAISRVAEPGNEEDLLQMALHTPTGQLERLLRGLRTAKRDTFDSQPAADSPRLGVQWRWDDDGNLVIWGRLGADDGARLLAALTRTDYERTRGHGAATDTADGTADGSAEPSADAGGSAEPPPGPTPCVGARPSADLGPALVAAAEWVGSAVAAPTHTPGADLVVHVDIDTLIDTATDTRQSHHRTPAAHLDDGPAVRDAVLQMLACDSRAQLCLRAGDGRTLHLGRRRRRPTGAQFTALWRRDRGCAAPGCDRTRFLHAHHVVAWAGGGHTDLDNLILLCGEHHRLLHHGGFTITAMGRQRFDFHGPGGATRPQAPPIRGNPDDLTHTHPDITPTTIEPDWDGAPLHLHEAVATYLTSWADTAQTTASAAAGASAQGA